MQQRPVFLPHLQGERAPLWDIDARAVFAGLDGSTGPAELATAVFEGVAYSARWLLESLEASGDCRPEAMLHAGGGASSDIWCQIRANVLGRPIKRTTFRDAGVLGAALLAGVGAGLYGSIAEAAEQIVKVERVFEPVEDQRSDHDRQFALFKSLYANVTPFNRVRAGR
jgi:xylulokinase